MVRSAMMLLAGVALSALAWVCWGFARRAQAGRKRRLHLLEMELRLTDASEAFHQEVFRLKHLRVLRPGLGRNAVLISSKNVSSLRYIKGRENAD